MEIRRATDADRDTMLHVWEQSARATHGFVAPSDLAAMVAEVRSYLAGPSEFWVACDGPAVVGFMGLAGDEMESLFLAPEVQRRGVGRRMVAHARTLRPALTVKVNESNASARAFYEACGFEVAGRSDLDDQGRPYPLLHLRLRTTPQ